MSIQTPSIQTLISKLTEQGFDDTQLKTDADSLDNWGRDWTKHFDPAASLIVFPKSTEQVQAVVLACNELGLVITPSGGRTGLSAGAVASNGEVVIAWCRCRRVW